MGSKKRKRVIKRPHTKGRWSKSLTSSGAGPNPVIVAEYHARVESMKGAYAQLEHLFPRHRSPIRDEKLDMDNPGAPAIQPHDGHLPARREVIDRTAELHELHKRLEDADPTNSVLMYECGRYTDRMFFRFDRSKIFFLRHWKGPGIFERSPDYTSYAYAQSLYKADKVAWCY